VVVEDDPRMQMAPADRAARREAIEQLYAMAKTLDKERKTIEGIKEGLKVAREQWKKDADKPEAPKIPAEIQKATEELQKKVDAVAEKYAREREGLGNAGPALEWKPEPLPQQVQGLLRDLDGFWAAPGGQQKDKLAELPPLVNDASAQVKKIVEVDLTALNKKMNDAGIPHIVPVQPQRPAGRGGVSDDEAS
jgi:predicted transcriptional regulator